MMRTNFRRLAALSLVLLAAAPFTIWNAASASSSSTVSHSHHGHHDDHDRLPIYGVGGGKMKPSKLNTSPEIKASSTLGQTLLSHARRLDNNNGIDTSFLADYSIKFQGCHHISQWNEEADDEDDVRIATKRLVRFRLCPSGSCSNDNSSGCTQKYGDYVVDMSTFVGAYLQAEADEKDYQCQLYQNKCENECNGNGDDQCEYACYAAADLSYCLDDNGDDALANFDPLDYAYCAQWDFNRRLLSGEQRHLEGRQLDGDVEYYIGPYCADQGGEINLGLFTDDTCTTFSSCGENCFLEWTGQELPYSDDSLISGQCMSCADSGNNYYVKDICSSVYSASGKCETKMSDVDYPNESACTYIEGIKIIRGDGVIRTRTTKKSRAAAVCIGLFTTLAVLLGAYVHYLRTKLGRAKINLSSANSPLT